jgi:hypothetical protein
VAMLWSVAPYAISSDSSDVSISGSTNRIPGSGVGSDVGSIDSVEGVGGMTLRFSIARNSVAHVWQYLVESTVRIR